MAFVDGSITQKVNLVDATARVSKLARLLTHGSGVVTDQTAEAVDEQCLLLQTALAQLGYADTPAAGEASVKDGATVPVRNSAGTAVSGTHTVDVVDSKVNYVALDATIWPLNNGNTSVRITNSAGATITSAGGATVADGVGSVKLPSNWTAVNNGSSVTLGGSTYTFQVSNGVLTGITVS